MIVTICSYKCLQFKLNRLSRLMQYNPKVRCLRACEVFVLADNDLKMSGIVRMPLDKQLDTNERYVRQQSFIREWRNQYGIIADKIFQ